MKKNIDSNKTERLSRIAKLATLKAYKASLNHKKVIVVRDGAIYSIEDGEETFIKEIEKSDSQLISASFEL